MSGRLIRIFAPLWLAAIWLMTVNPAEAAGCSYATGQGSSGPASWQSYCWLDLSGYNDVAARSASGQNMSFTLSDGTVMTFNLKVSGTAVVAQTSPTWSGSPFGNSAFTGVPGKPILYMTVGGSVTATISNIVLTPPSGGSITNYMFVVADGEATGNNEYIQLTTNGGGWQILDQMGSPSGGSIYPTLTGTGTSTLKETGTATSNWGGYVVGSTMPSSVTTVLNGPGLEGAAFAVRFASLRLNTTIANARVDPADQFTYSIAATGSGATFATAASSGTGLGPFTWAPLASTARIPLTLRQTMAAGSSSTLADYQSTLTCTNSTTGTGTTLPNNVVTSSYSFGSLNYGDIVSCTFTETPFPHLTLIKALSSGGRQFASDQFVMKIVQGSATVATTTTTGSGATITNGSTPHYLATVNTVYQFNEAGAGATSMTQYTATMSCSNASSGSTTALPTIVGGTVTPKMGDVITCTITNTKVAAKAALTISKSSAAFSDPLNGSTFPKLIPGSIALYTIQVQNAGPGPVDNNTVFVVDSLPAQISVGTAASPTFSQGTPTSGLTFSSATDIRYSNAVSAPTSFAACTYTPVAAYDPAVKFICINPKGTMAASTGTPTGFSVTFQSQIK